MQQAYVAALSAKRAQVDLLEFALKHADIVKAEMTIGMGMIAQNAVRRIAKADELMKGQSEAVKSEMESCTDKIGAVPRWENNSKRYEQAVTKLNDLIDEL